MPVRRPVRWVLAAILAAGAVLGLAACGGSTQGPRPGGGGGSVDYQTVTQGHLVVQMPASWTASHDVTKPFDVKYTGDGMEVQIAGEFSEDSSAYAALGRLDLPATLKLDGYKPVTTEKIGVENAYDAVQRSFTYSDGGSTRHGVWVVATQWPYPASAVLSVSGKTVDDDVVAHLTQTLEFKKFH